MKNRALVGIILLLAPVLAWSQAFSLFQPANGILKGSTSTFVTTSASALDVRNLFSGVCDSTTYLRGDGTCAVPSGSGIGTVTSVGLAWTGSGLTVSNSPVTSSGTLTFSGVLNVATGGIGVGTLTGIAKGNGTSAFSAAASSDVISLWTGTCNTTTFLRGDGSCQTIPGNTDASTLTTGTLADARLSANVPLKNAANSFSALQTFTVASPTTAGQLALRGGSTGATNQAFVSFNDSAGTRKGYVGDSNTGDSGIQLAADAAGANIDLIPGSGGAATVAGSVILTASSGLNGSNVTSGTVADARLSANVPLKNTANTFTNSSGTTFTNVGNTVFSVANSSTGFVVSQVATNGVSRGDLCTSTTTGQCATGDAANDVSLRSAQRIHLSPSNSGVTATFATSQIDLNAPTNVQGSPVKTLANSGRFASGRVRGSDGALLVGFNVTSVTRTGVGNYTINVGAAGFSAPSCTASVGNNTSDGHPSVQYGAGAVFGVSMYTSGFVTADYDFSFTCMGN